MSYKKLYVLSPKRKQNGCVISKQRLFDGVDLFVALLAALVADRAAGLASGLAAGLALAAADVTALLHSVFDYAVDVFHSTPPMSVLVILL